MTVTYKEQISFSSDQGQMRSAEYQDDLGYWVALEPSLVTNFLTPAVIEFGEPSAIHTLWGVRDHVKPYHTFQTNLTPKTPRITKNNNSCACQSYRTTSQDERSVGKGTDTDLVICDLE